MSQWLTRLLDKVACGSLDWFVVSIPSTLGVRASGSKSASAGRLIKQAGEPVHWKPMFLNKVTTEVAALDLKV